MKDEVWHALIVVISNASDLHGYTVRGLYRAFQTAVEQVYKDSTKDMCLISESSVVYQACMSLQYNVEMIVPMFSAG